MLSRLLVFVCAIGFVCAASVQAQTVWHVDDDASTNGDGLTWGTAYKYLQDALAASSDGDEIRIAGGIYKPDQDEGGIVTPGDRSETFQMVLGVPIYGGYAGLADPGSPDERNIDGYVTILSGDLAGDDGPDFAGYDENSYRVVTGHQSDSEGRLDGVTVAGGNGTGGPGGGAGLHAFFFFSGPPGPPHLTLDNCTFTGNLGAGAYLDGNYWDGSATVTHCTFTGNQGRGLYYIYVVGTTEVTDCTFSGNLGGGMYANETRLALTGCTFIGNSATGAGGGLRSIFRGASLVDCVFVGNSAQNGGALFIDEGELIWSLANCLFVGNMAEDRGGVLYSDWSRADLVNCTLSGNRAGIEGGALYASYISADLTSCIVWDNDEPQIVDGESRGTTATYSDIQGNWPGEGNINVDPLFADPDGPDGNPNTFEDNDYRLAAGSPCVDTGDNAAVTTTTDLAGNPRIVDGDLDGTPTVDMGVYECQENCAEPPIPTVSEWGLVVMAVLVLGAGAMIFQNRRTPRPVE